MTDNGHFIDDPLDVANAKPDFSGMDLKPVKQPKRMGFWTFSFIMVFIALVIICILQHIAIRNYQQSEDEWVVLSYQWREALDTCMNRNERIYEQLYKFQDIRIKQLKEKKQNYGKEKENDRASVQDAARD